LIPALPLPFTHVFSGCVFAPWRLCVKKTIQREGAKAQGRKALKTGDFCIAVPIYTW
jgi:hypothetical protein